MKTIKFRKALITDIKILREFQYELGVHERILDDNLKKDSDIKYYSDYKLKKYIKSDQSLCLIAEQKNEAIGLAVALIKKQKGNWWKSSYKGYIDFLFVKEENRGQGIGKKLIKESITWFKRKKVSDIRLIVFHNNTEALELYRNMGFQDYIFEMSYKKSP